MSPMFKSTQIESFLQKFKNFNSLELSIERYPQYYFNHILSHLDYYATIYKQIIDLAINAAQKPASELILLDYGAGNGFLGMFAKCYGFKEVWMSDLSSDFLNAAKQTSTLTKIDINGFIVGDIDVVRLYFDSKKCKPDIILSTDVIEHIYDIDAFFKELNLFNPNLVSVFTTASNPYNKRKVRALHRLQYKDEWVGYADMLKDEQAERGFLSSSFYEQRKIIIKKHFSEMSEEQISELALKTRGKRKDDILISVNKFLNERIDPMPPEDTFWVCHPYTGSWTERILPLNEYKKAYQKNHFSFTVFNGFYNHFSKKGVVKLIVRVLNEFISKNKRIGKYFAPYIIFLGVPVKFKTSSKSCAF